MIELLSIVRFTTSIEGWCQNGRWLASNQGVFTDEGSITIFASTIYNKSSRGICYKHVRAS